MHYVRLHEVFANLGVDEPTIELLVQEGIIEVKHSLEDESLLSEQDVERVRVSITLMRDLDINIAGVEVILRMREDLLATHRQFDQILHELVGEMRKRIS